MPSTSMSLRKNAAAAVEMTALAAGAGPPANKIATRLSEVVFLPGPERVLDMKMLRSRRPPFAPTWILRLAAKGAKVRPGGSERCQRRLRRQEPTRCGQPPLAGHSGCRIAAAYELSMAGPAP